MIINLRESAMSSAVTSGGGRKSARRYPARRARNVKGGTENNKKGRNGEGKVPSQNPSNCHDLAIYLCPWTVVVSRASRIFPSGVRMRVNKFCVGGEGKIRLVTVARFSYRGGM